MAALSITSLVSFFRNEQKSVSRGENHYKSNHVESFTYSDGIIRGEVHASMRNKVYKATVSNGLDDGIRCMFSSRLNVALAVINTVIERLWFKSYIFLQLK